MLLASLEPEGHADGEQAKREQAAEAPRRRAARLGRGFLARLIGCIACRLVQPLAPNAAMSRSTAVAGLGHDTVSSSKEQQGSQTEPSRPITLLAACKTLAS